MSSATWDPAQYLRYAGERERPFLDLVARVRGDPPRRVVDLGCGPGNATAGLLDRWPRASILGLDGSPEMIARARELAGPRLSFEVQDIRSFAPEPGSLDLILSNAALHWVPGHLELFGAWLEGLAEGGTLAFQVPRNFDQPSHALLRELASAPRWADRLAGVGARMDLPSAESCYDRLRALGAAVDLWETTYLHVLTGEDPVLEWVRGTALRPYLSALAESEAAELTASYAEKLRQAYPARPSGETLLPFRRMFVVARRTG